MSDVFDAAADLSGITTAERLFVTQAVHCANVTVDEVGTEAAAATAVVAAPAAARVSTTPPVEFTVDRPFAFEIVDTQTAAPLFLGTVSDPAATQ
jgi:serpin B